MEIKQSIEGKALCRWGVNKPQCLVFCCSTLEVANSKAFYLLGGSINIQKTKPVKPNGLVESLGNEDIVQAWPFEFNY